MAEESVQADMLVELDPLVPLVRVRGTRPILVHVCGFIESYYVHWCPVLARTQPCIRGECTYCRQNLPRRPMSYSGILHWRLHGVDIGWFRSVLEVPFRAGLRLADLRGRCVSLRRQGACGRVDIQPGDVRVSQPTHAAFSPLPALRALWRITRSQQCTLVTDDV